MIMSRIDYSKWNHIVESDDDDEEEEERYEAPRVTKFDQPSRITTQVDGSFQVAPPNAAAASPSHESAVATKETAPTDDIPSAWTKKGDHVVLSDNTELWWSQDRYSVTLRMALDHCDVKIQKVQLQGVLPYSERHLATGSFQKPRLVVRLANDNSIWFQGELPHAVHLAEDADDDNDIDWSVVQEGSTRRYLTLILYKATPMAGMFHWWKQPFTQCPERPCHDDDNHDHSNSGHSFQQAWKEAQTQFVESIKNRPKHEL